MATEEKTLDVVNTADIKKKAPAVKVVGNPDQWRLLIKASLDEQGWMKSTKVMITRMGAVIQTTSQQRNPDGSYALCDALQFVPGLTEDDFDWPKLDD